MPLDHPPERSRDEASRASAAKRLSPGTSLLVIALGSLVGWFIFMLVAKTLWGLAGY
jgi:hypothetical protein